MTGATWASRHEENIGGIKNIAVIPAKAGIQSDFGAFRSGLRVEESKMDSRFGGNDDI